MSVQDEINEVFRDRVRRTVTAPEVRTQLCLGMIRGLLREQADLSGRLDAVERRLPPIRFKRRWWRRRNRLVRPPEDAELFDLTAGARIEHQPGPVPAWMHFAAALVLTALGLWIALASGR